ncbi:MAG: glycosyltransferase family 2 protein [Holophagales bacterium]|jgi:glycosyltransferase involved in cell wall biosynthesis|nr:glycosyltransferase family 2 protein [Holophagales bacterium]MBK9964166.1 glycosyltransferase family 2 protein [Holophagales bacterium]
MTDSPPPGTRESLTVIVPCLNEEGNIARTVKSVRAVLATIDLEGRIELIDDGSTDGTVREMERLCEAHEGIGMHVNPRNLGVGRSVLQAYDRIPEGHWATVAAGDNEIVFDSIRNHLEMRHRYDIVLGYLQNSIIRTIPRRIASEAFTRTIRLIYGYPYRYLNGLKLYRVDAFRGIDVVSSGHAFNAELLAKAVLRNPNLRIGEAPFLARGRAMGNSKAIRLRSVLKAVSDVYRGYRSVSAYRELAVRMQSED